MNSNPILERNLENLLRRSYTPAPCRPEFRASLLTELLVYVGRSPSATAWKRLTRITIAASILLGAGVAAWSLTDARKGEHPRTERLGAGVVDPQRANGPMKQGGDLRLDKGGAIHVNVKDPKGVSIVGAELRFVDESGEDVQFAAVPMVSGFDGVSRATGVKPGRWRVLAFESNRKTGEGTVDVREQETSVLDIVVAR